MLYQLPNGKVVSMSLDDYLNLTDEDIQALVAQNYGTYPTSYWYESCLNRGETEETKVNGLDYRSFEEQDEYVDKISSKDLDSIPDEESDFTDI
jgi:hypothetical protein